MFYSCGSVQYLIFRRTFRSCRYINMRLFNNTIDRQASPRKYRADAMYIILNWSNEKCVDSQSRPLRKQIDYYRVRSAVKYKNSYIRNDGLNLHHQTSSSYRIGYNMQTLINSFFSTVSFFLSKVWHGKFVEVTCCSIILCCRENLPFILFASLEYQRIIDQWHKSEKVAVRGNSGVVMPYHKSSRGHLFIQFFDWWCFGIYA